MSRLDCCLWLNRKKISSAAEIIGNFDLAAVRGYFLGGSLSEWLREHGGAAYADRLESIDPKDPELNGKLAGVFGMNAGAVPETFCGGAPSACCGCGGFPAGSFGSWMSGSGSGSFAYGSFGGSGGGSGSGGSFGLLGSYRFSLWEWEWEWRFARRGSFSLGSLSSLGSFGSYRLGAGSYFLGSFGVIGSYRFGSGSYLLGNAGSFHGSFWYGSGGVMTSDEYDRIMYETLRKCPLDCYGYGIHIV